MCEVRLSGLTRIEECRLRFELASDSDPFVDAEVAIDNSLSETIALLQRVQAAVGEAPAQATGREKEPTTRSPRVASEPATAKGPAATKSSDQKNPRWKGIVEALCSGDLDVFTRREKSAAAAATVKWQLGKTYEGLEVTTEPSNDGSVLLSVRLGSFGRTRARRAA